MKKLFTLMAAFAVVPSVMAVEFAGGDGTAANPYQITTVEQLQAMNDIKDANYILMNDIDLDGVNWTPIGSDVNNAFTGKFDGQNHVISNFYHDGGSAAFGLFGRCINSGVIENFTIEYAELYTGNWSGIVCANLGNWEANGGTVRNVNVYNSIIVGPTCMGGIAGTFEGTIEGCALINVTVEGEDAAGSIGGLIGCSECGKPGHIWDSVFYGNVTGITNVGGIAGCFNPGSDLSAPAIKNCTVYGNITATGAGGNAAGFASFSNDWDGVQANWWDNNACFANIRGGQVGGFSGNAARGKISNCYATGTLTIPASLISADTPWSGGIAATDYCTKYPISDVYFGGKIIAEGEANAGAILGRQWQGVTIENAFYIEDCGANDAFGEPGDCTIKNVSALLPEQSKTLASYGFSDSSRWQIVDGVTTPFLANQTAPVEVSVCSENTLSGTCSASLENLYIIGSASEFVKCDVKVDGTQFTVDFEDEEVVVDETLTIIAQDKDCMTSMPTMAKVTEGSGVKGILSDYKALTAKVVGKSVILSAEADYAVYSVAGEVLKKGFGTTVNLDKVSVGCYIVSVNRGETTIKLIVR